MSASVDHGFGQGEILKIRTTRLPEKASNFNKLGGMDWL